METINNVAQAAVKAVWGTDETKEEPVSGRTGNTTAGEPYDAGNIEHRGTTGVTGSDSVKPTEFASTTGHDTKTSGGNYTTSSDKYTGTTAATDIAPLESSYNPAGGVNTSGTEHKPIRSGNDVSSSSNTDFTSTGSSGLNTSRDNEKDDHSPAGGVNTTGTEFKPYGSGNNDKPSSNTDLTSRDSSGLNTSRDTEKDDHNSASGIGVSGNESKPATDESRAANTSGSDTTSSSAGPHKEFGSSVKPNEDLSAAQQDTRDPADPKTNPKEAANKSNVDDTGDGLDKGDNPTKIDGPGPRPLEEVAKEHGGDAGLAAPDAKHGDAGQKTGDDDEDDDGPQKTSHGEGTGEQYVKSSGLKADGGDFDAMKPGAGKEADRLLETKGVHRSEDPKPSAPGDHDATDVAGGHEKKSLKDKIKEKLHKH